jgi:cytochrome P450
MAVVKVPISHEISGHKAVREALRDTGTYSSDLQGDADVRQYRQLPLEIDPPRHHLFRAALAPYFVKPAIEKFIPEFEELAREHITKFFAEGGDVISNLALPLVMANLGVIYNRPQDVQEWIEWGPDVWTAAGPIRSGDVLHGYLDRIYEEALISEKNDMWSEIARLEIDGRVVSPEEFRGITGVLLAGGRDTVVKLLTGIVWHLGNSQRDFDLLKKDSKLFDGAIDELLRFLSPLPAMARTTTPESTTKDLPTDRYVQVSFISANFDDTVFENPYEINILRARNPHLSFGFGPHTCIGNHIAEIEAKIFLKALLEVATPWEVSNESEIRFYEGALSSVPAHFAHLIVKSTR